MVIVQKKQVGEYNRPSSTGMVTNRKKNVTSAGCRCFYDIVTAGGG